MVLLATLSPSICALVPTAAPNARDILALRKVNEWKADADKYRKLMSERMSGVRAAKNAPKISRPGQPQAAGVTKGKQVARDRAAMRGGDRDAARRVLSEFF